MEGSDDDKKDGEKSEAKEVKETEAKEVKETDANEVKETDAKEVKETEAKEVKATEAKEGDEKAKELDGDDADKDDMEEGGDSHDEANEWKEVMETDEVDDGDVKDQETSDKNDEEPSNLQLAWEMLEVAKVAYTKQIEETGDADNKKECEERLCKTIMALGEVSIENENYCQAVEDLQMCLKKREAMPKDSRLVAETQYQHGVAQGFNKQYDDAG